MALSRASVSDRSFCSHAPVCGWMALSLVPVPWESSSWSPACVRVVSPQGCGLSLTFIYAFHNWYTFSYLVLNCIAAPGVEMHWNVWRLGLDLCVRMVTSYPSWCNWFAYNKESKRVGDKVHVHIYYRWIMPMRKKKLYDGLLGCAQYTMLIQHGNLHVHVVYMRTKSDHFQVQTKFNVVSHYCWRPQTRTYQPLCSR